MFLIGSDNSLILSSLNNSKLNYIFSDPCFNSGEELTGLQRGDAEYVLAIHSNSGGLGKRDPLGNYSIQSHINCMQTDSQSVRHNYS